MDELVKRGIELKLRKLFDEQSYFCVIDFEAIMKAMGHLSKAPDDIHLYHCVHYTKMGTETKQMLFKRCMNYIGERCQFTGFLDNVFNDLNSKNMIEAPVKETEIVKSKKWAWL